MYLAANSPSLSIAAHADLGDTATPPRVGWLARQAARAAAALRQTWQDRQTRIVMASLDDHLLRDIGYERTHTNMVERIVHV